jgi:phospholipid/cholesterol/gamma-HCH transport system substrate-binding protein
MPTDRSVELRVGIAVVIAAILLILAIIWVKEYRFNVVRYKYSVIFPNVGALEKGDPVTISGVKKGEVEDIKLYQGDVLVAFNLTSDAVLKEDAKFTVMNIGLMGERYIEIFAGHSDKLLDLSEPVRGYYDTGIPEIMGMMGEAVTDIRNLVSHLEGAVGTKWSQESIIEITKNLRKVSNELNQMMERNKDKFNGSVDDLSYASSELKSLVKDNKGKLQSTVNNFASASTKLDSITTSLGDISSSLKSFSEKIKRGEGTLGSLVQDSSLYLDLRKTTKDLDSLILDIKANPKKYIKLKVF